VKKAPAHGETVFICQHLYDKFEAEARASPLQMAEFDAVLRYIPNGLTLTSGDRKKIVYFGMACDACTQSSAPTFGGHVIRWGYKATSVDFDA
jgi:hypothetical protein